jgi:hypothetical protein
VAIRRMGASARRSSIANPARGSRRSRRASWPPPGRQAWQSPSSADCRNDRHDRSDFVGLESDPFHPKVSSPKTLDRRRSDLGFKHHAEVKAFHWTKSRRGQLLAGRRLLPIAAKPGRPARIGYQYERNGTANIFMLFAPLEGWRQVEVTARHTAGDYAHLLKQVSDTWFPMRRRSRSFRQSQHPQTRLTVRGVSRRRGAPHRRAVRVALHAQHGSWLNMAETELSVLSGQCLDRRISRQGDAD